MLPLLDQFYVTEHCRMIPSYNQIWIWMCEGISQTWFSNLQTGVLNLVFHKRSFKNGEVCRPLHALRQQWRLAWIISIPCLHVAVFTMLVECYKMQLLYLEGHIDSIQTVLKRLCNSHLLYLILVSSETISIVTIVSILNSIILFDAIIIIAIVPLAPNMLDAPSSL